MLVTALAVWASLLEPQGSGDALFENVFAANRRITTYECQFVVQRRLSLPGKPVEESRYSGLHRYRAPDDFYTEFYPVDLAGTRVSQAREIHAGSRRGVDVLTISSDGRPSAVVSAGSNMATPIRVGQFLLPRYLRDLEQKFAASKTESEFVDGLVMLRGSASHSWESYTVRADPQKGFAVVGIELKSNLSSGQYTGDMKLQIEQMSGGDWTCTGGEHRQVNPDGHVADHVICTIVKDTVRLNQPISDELFKIRYPEMTPAINEMTKEVYTLGSLQALNRRIDQQLRTADSIATGVNPKPQGLRAAPDFWATYRFSIIAILTALLLGGTALWIRRHRLHSKG